MKFSVVKDFDGKIVTAGYCSLTPGVGQTLTEYDDPPVSVLAQLDTERKDAEGTKTAPYTASVADESITLVNLVKLLKVKGVI